jgi:hypothetical protein
MGEPIRIRDMAEQMIRFYGFEPGEDIRIEYTGLRPGERLGEKLWAEDESPSPTPYSRILRVERRAGAGEPGLDISALLEKLRPVCKFDPARPASYRNRELLRELLAGALPGFRAPSPPAGEPPEERLPAAEKAKPEKGKPASSPLFIQFPSRVRASALPAMGK